MLAFLAVVVTVGLFAYDYYSIYEGGAHGGYYEDYSGNHEDNSYGEYSHYGDYYSGDDYSHTNDAPSHNNEGISPLGGITVTFNLTGGNPPLGETNPMIAMTNHQSGTNVWIGTGVGQFPPDPYRLDGRAFMGWNTQPDGWGMNFTGETQFHQDNWIAGAPTPFTVYAIWGVSLHFNGNPVGLPMTPNDRSNPNSFVTRMIPYGWTLTEAATATWITPTNVWPDITTVSYPGFGFIGWYDTSAITGGEEVGPNTRLYTETIAFARWAPLASHVVTFDPTQGNIAGGHTNTRNARNGWSIFASGTSQPGFPAINTMTWPRSAPLATLSGMTLEGWWTGHDGYHGTGIRFASPGGDTVSPQLPTPADWARRPITETQTVYANWVYRVTFHMNYGFVTINGQPDGFYDRHDNQIHRWHWFHSGTANILFRDIPYGIPLEDRTVALHGQQYNYGPINFDPLNPEEQLINNLGQIEPRRYLPDGIRAPGHTTPPMANEHVNRPGHLFNGWWCTQLPPQVLVGGVMQTIDPRNPATLVGTQWQGQTFTEFTADSQIPASKTVFAHWIPNPNVTVTFMPGDGAEWYRPYLQNPAHPNWQHNPPMTPILGTNLPYHLSFTYGSFINNTQPRLSMPPRPRKDGYVMLGWFTNPPPEPCPNPGTCADCAANNGAGNANAHGHLSREDRGHFFRYVTVVTEGSFRPNTLVNNELIVYAHWAPYITMRFVGNGGTGNDFVRRVAYGTTTHTYWNNNRPGGAGPGWHTQTNPLSWELMRTFGYVSILDGHLASETLPPVAQPESNFTRPGMRPLRVNAGGQGWQRPAVPHPVQPGVLPDIPGLPNWSPRNGSAFNICPNGTHDIFGTSVPTQFMWDIDVVNGNREVIWYMQWGVPIEFRPVQSLGPSIEHLPVIITVPAGHSFQTMHTNRHMPPNSVIPPAQAIPWPDSAPPANHNNTRLLSFPDPTATTDPRHWTGINTGLGARGWYPTIGGTGTRITATTQMPTHHLGQVVNTVYFQWGHVITFDEGAHPDRSQVIIQDEHRTRSFSAGTFTINSLAGGMPPNPTYPTGPMDPVFGGWRTAEGVPVIGTTSLTRASSFTLYAHWELVIPLNANAPGRATLTTPGGTHVRGGAGGNFNFGIVVAPTRTQGGDGPDWRFFNRWSDTGGGPGGIIYTASGPAAPDDPELMPETLFAQWEGRFIFNPLGGTIPNTPGITIGGNGHATVYVTEHYSIASHSARVAGPPTTAGNALTGTIPQMPHNPTHPDPSMVFMGWRITSGPLAGMYFNDSIVFNAVVDASNPENIIRNAPSGIMNIEAMWSQRLVFTKTSECLYLVYPNTNDNDRQRQPRDGAVFNLEREVYNSVTSTFSWVTVQTGLTSGAEVPGLGTASGSYPFVPALPASPGRVATAPLTANTRYRLIETLPPLGYMREGVDAINGHWYWIISTIPPAAVSGATTAPADASITSIVAVDHPLEFFDWNIVAPTANMRQNWHVGNRRPRLDFTKFDRHGVELDGVVFVVEQRTRANPLATWGSWNVVYTTQPSGSIAVPHLPAQPGPLNAVESGSVAITRPFTPSTNAADTLVQYRLRETIVPSGMGYLIPTGYWNITTNRYSGIVDIARSGAATPFSADAAPPSAVNDWPVNWEVGNTPTRYWPFFKTNDYMLTPNQIYLPGAIFRLFVYNGTEEPAHTLISSDIVVDPAPATPQPGTWSLVIERTSNGGSNPDPMWFPMMPGRYYQLVEIVAPAGFQVPWGQWRITVTGAVDAATIQGTGLHPEVISAGTGVGTPSIVPISNYFVHGDCSPNCHELNCEEAHADSYNAFLISNRPDFDLPMTGGAGALLVTVAGLGLAGLSLVLLLAKSRSVRMANATANVRKIG